MSARKRSIPGLASPIELSMPTSVSAMRTGSLPSRGSGVTVFVTKASKLLRDVRRGERVETAGGVQDHAACSRTGPFDTEAFELSVDLDRAAVARAVAAGHRRLPGELRARARARATARSIGSGPQARTSWPGGMSLRDERRLDHDLGVGTSAAASACACVRKPSTAGGRPSRSDEVREAARRRSRRRRAAVARRRGGSRCRAARARASRSPRATPVSARVPGPIGSMRKPSSVRVREAEAHRPGQQPPGRREHEELARDRRTRAARARGGAAGRGRLSSTRDDVKQFSLASRSWSESASSLRARAIASTAANAPASVVMQGTRATSAASRMR